MVRVIGHLDLDYFYAQVEEVEDPSIKKRPVLVCVFSGRTEDSGVVSTANYVARSLGIGSGMPIAVAKRKLDGKDPTIIKMEHRKYEAISERIMNSMQEQVESLEKTGIDEAYFDLTRQTGGDYSAARVFAEKIKKSILDQEHLTSSVGVGRSKTVAKIGSDISKPDGMTVVLPGSTATFLAPLAVRKLNGVGPKTATILESMGIRTIGGLADAQFSSLEQRLGRKLATNLFACSTGSDEDPVLANLEPTQFSRIVTLKQDTRDPDEAMLQLNGAIADLHQKLTETGKAFRSISAICILTDLTTKTRSKTFETPLNDIALIRENSLGLFRDLSGSTGRDFRRVGIRVGDLSSTADQTSLSQFSGSPR